jgi:molecular chaperone DnaK
MAAVVGIDLGTTNTVVAAVRDGVAGTIPDPEGSRLIPSVVSFHPSGSVIVGRAALERRLIDASSTIYSVKRLIGRAWGSPLVEQARGKLPFELREGPAGGTVVIARGETYSLPEISAFVLRQAKAVAEAAMGAPVESAVITVPANFNDLQRAATKTAGRLAGLDVLRILNEPTAAALAYGPQGKAQERIAVYDLGGGTFDVTILDLAGNVFEVLATSGDTALGGGRPAEEASLRRARPADGLREAAHPRGGDEARALVARFAHAERRRPRAG